jgi:translation initiation factor 1A
MGRKEREKQAAAMKSTVSRVRMPNREAEEMFGVVAATLGGARMLVFCEDGKERICRIPGKIKNRVWVKERDYVVIRLWVTEKDTRGDIVWRYRELETSFLRSRGFLNFMNPQRCPGCAKLFKPVPPYQPYARL